MQTVELIETLFNETRNQMNQRLDTLERQVNLVLSSSLSSNKTTPTPTEMSSEFEFAKHFNALSQKLAGISSFLDQMNYRLKQLEEHSTHQTQKTQTHLRTPILGPQHLEGLVMVPEIKVSKKDESDLDTKNIVIQPHFTFPINDFTELHPQEEVQSQSQVEEEEAVEEEEQVEEQEEVVEEEQEEVVEEEEQEEVVEKELVEEEEQEEEEQEVEEVEEPLELEEFLYKNKKYFKDQYNKVYRQIDEETPEDEPFAEYNEETKKLTRLPN